jgi:hypothetical protein
VIFYSLFQSAAQLLVILIPAWPAVLEGAIFFLSWSAISLPATMSLVVNLLPTDKGTMAFPPR